MPDINGGNVSLVCQFAGADGSTTFTDDSTNGFTLTGAGSAQIQSGQLELDGDGDYLSLSNSTTLVDTSGAFTVEAICTFDVVPGSAESRLDLIFATSNSSGRTGFALYRFENNLSVEAYTSTGTALLEHWPTGGSIAAATEHHVAVTRTAGGSWRLWIDGVENGSAASESAGLDAGQATAYIGAQASSFGDFNGRIKEFRITNGTDRYTGSFTAPSTFYEVGQEITVGQGELILPSRTVALAGQSATTQQGTPIPWEIVYDSNTSLLLHFDGTDGATTDTDRSSYGHTFTWNGDAQIDTAQSKFGGSALLCDGTGDYLQANDDSKKLAYQFASSTYTIDFWVRFASLTGQQYLIQFGTTTDFNLHLYKDTSNRIVLYLRGVRVTSSAVSVDTWHHVRLVRDSPTGNNRLFLDGVYQGAYALDVNNVAKDGYPYIGIRNDGLYPLNGWIDELAIFNGTAKNSGTTTFTVPAGPYGNYNPPLDVITQVPTPLGAPEIVTETGESFIAEIPTPLGAPEVLTEWSDQAIVVLPSPLNPPAPVLFSDFVPYISTNVQRYVMRLLSTLEVEIPISSWQSTLQTDRQNYLTCAVPAASQYLADITASLDVDEFAIYKITEAAGLTVEWEIARVPLQTATLNQGGFRTTITLSGYGDPFTPPPARQTFTLADLISLQNTLGGNIRVRAAIDWYIRPGDTVTADGNTFTVAYINYYVTSEGQAYMDLGSR